MPRIGVTRVGDVANTFAPLPVSSVSADARLAEENEPSDVAFPTDVIAPVKLAFVVTLPAVSPEAVPVIFVPTRAEGVPRAGVTRVGDVANTSAPDPVSSLITPASSAEVVAAKAESLSVVTTKVLEAGTVVPLSVVVLEDERLVKAPEDGFAAPIAVFVRPTAE